ncbi:hypothetical protein GQ464_003540 [Rhodocaloribacter litoris]|uniref:hypothetical protein n=1 Tax=Rhodocaloribacter litoris TaxID=2558931 RepID=UPI0014226B70|nr:hypothetical protein [Rhodocaloribacter litoris]QXD16034.1 hypothetical protein GQ464_003540 [Rhodocaloribacter litoris]
MDIRNATPGLNGTTPLQPASPHETGKPEPNVRPAPLDRASTASPGDRLDLSPEVQARLEVQRNPETLFARKALNELPGLSQERLETIKSRLEEGYYSLPKVLSVIADRVADELSGDLHAKAGLHTGSPGEHDG